MDQQRDACGHGCAGGEEVLYGKVAEVIKRYRDVQGSLIMVLHEAQEIFGYLPVKLQQFIADGLGLPASEVSGVVSFYSFFSTQRRGRHTIRVCQGTACYVRGRQTIVDEIRNQLHIDVGGTTEDGLFTLEIVRCIGACGLAPAMMIDEEVYKHLSPKKVKGILDLYRDKDQAEGGAGQ